VSSESKHRYSASTLNSSVYSQIWLTANTNVNMFHTYVAKLHRATHQQSQ